MWDYQPYDTVTAGSRDVCDHRVMGSNLRRSVYLVALAIGMVAAACTSSTQPTTTSTPTLPPVSSTSLAPPETTTTAAVLSDIDPALVGELGSDWVLFPDSGNGGYEVSLVDLTLVLSDDLKAIDGVALIGANATQDLQRFSLDARDLDISSVSVDGEAVESDLVDDELIVTLDAPLAQGDPFTVEVTYSAVPDPYSPTGFPFSMGWDRAPGGTLVFVHGFPGAAATWLPANEVKDDRARFIVRIDAPDRFDVTGSGSSSVDGDFVVWDTGREVSGFTFAIAAYQQSSIEWNGIPIDLDLTPGSPVRDMWSDAIPETLDYLESIFGPFPYERLGISAINGNPIALSTPMRILIPESMPTTVLVHELAHQWAGNAVTASDPETFGWMFEGLATYTETLFALRDSDTLPTGRFGVPDETRPLDQVDSVDDILDGATYQRGALLYQALRLEIGDEAFFATLLEFIQGNLHESVEIETLQATAEEISGMDLDAFFTAWVSDSVVPDLP